MTDWTSWQIFIAVVLVLFLIDHLAVHIRWHLKSKNELDMQEVLTHWNEWAISVNKSIQNTNDNWIFIQDLIVSKNNKDKANV